MMVIQSNVREMRRKANLNWIDRACGFTKVSGLGIQKFIFLKLYYSKMKAVATAALVGVVAAQTPSAPSWVSQRKQK